MDTTKYDQPVYTTVRRTEAVDIIPEWRYSKPVFVCVDRPFSDRTRIVGIRVYRTKRLAEEHASRTYLAALDVLGREALSAAWEGIK